MDAKHEVRQLAERYLEAWNGGNLEEVLSLHTPDSTFHLHAGADPVSGTAVRVAFLAGLEILPNPLWELKRLDLGDTFFVAQSTLSADDGRGGRLCAECVDVITVRNGLVARKDSYVDTAAVLAQLERTS